MILIINENNNDVNNNNVRNNNNNNKNNDDNNNSNTFNNNKNNDNNTKITFHVGKYIKGGEFGDFTVRENTIETSVSSLAPRVARLRSEGRILHRPDSQKHVFI